MRIKGYKAMNSDMTCLKYKFKVGNIYETNELVMCSNGFHFCENFFDVFEFYPKNNETIVCEIEALGDVLKENTKSVTNKIKIVKVLDDKEKLQLFMAQTNSGDWNSGDWNSGDWNSGNRNSGDWNSGDWNSGYGNSGNRNSGNRNSGDWNSGNWNSGNRNSGNRNSGDWNSGNRNSGDWNSGNWNSGYGNSGNRNSGYENSGDWNSGDGNSGNRNSGNRNSGDWNSGNWNSGYGNSGNRNSGYGNSGNRNSGDWNSGDGNSGYFNTTVPVYLFNKPSDIVYTKDFENSIRSLNVKPILSWIYENQMTESEKNDNPSHKTTGGFLRKTNKTDWSSLTEKDKEFIKKLPNFDNNIFMQISNGVSLLDEIEIIVNGVKKNICKKKAKEMGLIE